MKVVASLSHQQNDQKHPRSWWTVFILCAVSLPQCHTLFWNVFNKNFENVFTKSDIYSYFIHIILHIFSMFSFPSSLPVCAPAEISSSLGSVRKAGRLANFSFIRSYVMMSQCFSLACEDLTASPGSNSGRDVLSKLYSESDVNNTDIAND